MSVKAEMKKLNESIKEDRLSKTSSKKVTGKNSSSSNSSSKKVTIGDSKMNDEKVEQPRVSFEQNKEELISDNHISEPNEVFRFSNPTKLDAQAQDCETSAVSDNELALLTDF